MAAYVLFVVALLAGAVFVEALQVPGVGLNPLVCLAVLCHVGHVYGLPHEVLGQAELGMWRTYAVVGLQVILQQRGGVVVVLALVLQRTVEGEKQAAVLVLGVGQVVDVLPDLLFREGAAKDGEVVDVGLIHIIVAGIAGADDDGVVAHNDGAFLGAGVYEHAVNVEPDVVLLHMGIVGQGHVVPHACLRGAVAPAVRHFLAHAVHGQLGADAAVEGITLVAILMYLNIPSAVIRGAVVITVVMAEGSDVE